MPDGAKVREGREQAPELEAQNRRPVPAAGVLSASRAVPDGRAPRQATTQKQVHRRVQNIGEGTRIGAGQGSYRRSMVAGRFTGRRSQEINVVAMPETWVEGTGVMHGKKRGIHCMVAAEMREKRAFSHWQHSTARTTHFTQQLAWLERHAHATNHQRVMKGCENHHSSNAPFLVEIVTTCSREKISHTTALGAQARA